METNLRQKNSNFCVIQFSLQTFEASPGFTKKLCFVTFSLFCSQSQSKCRPEKNCTYKQLLASKFSRARNHPKSGFKLDWFFYFLKKRREVRLLMPGIDSAGKTTILYKLKLGEVVTTIPTIGFNVETIPYKNIDFTIWDVGGGDKIRPLWSNFHL